MLGRDETYLFVTERDYLLQLDTVANYAVNLYQSGTEFLRLGHTGLEEIPHPLIIEQSREQESKSSTRNRRLSHEMHITYEEYVIRHFRRSLFPRMDSLSQPPHNIRTRIDFSNSQHEGA